MAFPAGVISPKTAVWALDVLFPETAPETEEMRELNLFAFH